MLLFVTYLNLYYDQLYYIIILYANEDLNTDNFKIRIITIMIDHSYLFSILY